MTNEQIRKSIHVSGYGIYDNGLKVFYTWYKNRNQTGEERTLILAKKEALVELNAIGEIDYYGAGDLLEYNDEQMHWDEFRDKWIFSQWDAINLVNRHESLKALDAEIENSDIGKAVNNLLKK